MSRTTHLHPSDIRGFARLATQATAGLADLVEAMHHTITRRGGAGAAQAPARMRGIAGLVYKSVRGVTRLVGGGLDALLGRLGPELRGRASSPEREAVLAALNGVLGDYLVATGNPLAIAMSLRRDGRALVLERRALAAAFPRAGGKLALLAHGLCLNDLQWNRAGHDHGAVLARELGYDCLYLHYNSGLHTSTNGRALAGLLEVLLAQWPQPVEELAIVAHSMGGLVARSACHYGPIAGHAWPRRLRRLAFLGTPHLGAPMERAGNWVDVTLGATRYTAPFARLGKIRSAGITDLRHGNVLDEHWQGRDRFARAHDVARFVPLPRGVDSYALAASTGKKRGDLRDRLLGDGIVPVRSALGLEADSLRSLWFAKSRQWIGYGMSHLDLLGRREVSDRLVRWFASRPGAARPARRLT
ncbi:MAG TPA: alpha/beta hydrolase [Burkholderiales bacterium]|nr:alpha/beta hydrolase [Burkholderiales bacterium]